MQQQKPSTLEKLQRAISIIEDQQDDIMNTGNISAQLWDELLHPDLLGSFHPTAVITRAFLAQMKLMKDDILRDTILEYFASGGIPKRTKTTLSKDWFEAVKKQLSRLTVEPTRHERSITSSSSTTINLMDKMKIDVKLPSYDGTPDTCTDWFFSLEKNLARMKIDGADYLFYATGHTTGTAKDAITMLENKHRDDYSMVKKDLIEMFDVTKNQELYEQFLQRFRQLHTETVTSFYIKYQSQVHRLISRGIWPDDDSNKYNELSFFRAKLKPDISQQLSLLLQQHAVQENDIDLDKVYKYALIAEKLTPRSTNINSTPAAAIHPSSTRTIKCFYCDQTGHQIKECIQKKKNRKPCQRYIDSGKQKFGPDYEWDYTKKKTKQLSSQSTHSVLTQDESELPTVATHTTNSSQRTVAIILTDIKSSDTWFNDIVTLVDSGGCESCINTSFAYANNFTVFEDKSAQKQSPAISACGGQIFFNKYVEVEIKLGSTYTTEKFYLMDNLPRTLLLGYPFCERTGAILDPRAGTLFISDLKETIPLLRMKAEQSSELVFTTFGLSSTPLNFIPQSLLTNHVPFIKSSNHFASYVQAEISSPTHETNEVIMNVFGATTPRQRSSSIDNDIFKLQKQDYEDVLSDQEYLEQLQSLLDSHEDLFDTECTQPANIPPVHVDIKPEFEGKRFFRPEPLRSHKDQNIIDANYKKLIDQGKAKLNPTSIHNLGQVIVPRFDKEGNEIEGRARVCIDARPINKALVPYRYPIPNIKKIIHDLSQKKYFTEIDLSDSFQQFSISDELSNLLTVTCSFGKVSCTRLTYGVQFATDIFQETMSLELLEFLEKWLMIYVDNFLLSTAGY